MAFIFSRLELLWKFCKQISQKDTSCEFLRVILLITCEQLLPIELLRDLLHWCKKGSLNPANIYLFKVINRNIPKPRH